MKYNDVKIGEYYKYRWGKDRKEVDLVYVIGRDPFTSKFVASSKEWVRPALLLDLDFEMMEPI